MGLIIAIIDHERGIPSKRESSARVDYVPALCTHRPSLLPIEWLVRSPDRRQRDFTVVAGGEKLLKLDHLEEVKSRNKVSVGEPAEGSLPIAFKPTVKCFEARGVTAALLLF